MTSAPELGDFLRARRARLRPRDVGLPDHGERRRVAGLRREEVAQLAGVSVDYYTRLEQGRATGASGAVLNAVARALGLNTEETRHLHQIAHPPLHRTSAAAGPIGSAARPTAGPASGPAAPADPARDTPVRPSLLALLASMEEVPALVLNHRRDVLAWNRAASALLTDFADLPPGERNLAWQSVLGDRMRRSMLNSADCVRGNAGYLRLAAGRHPDDARLTALIEELSRRSEEFRRRWAEHPVADKSSGVAKFDHPLVGRMDLTYETLRAVGDPEQVLVAYTAEPGSPSRDALRMLLSWTADGSPVRIP
ncbi:helix-turn-helix domain-containing protein [Allostreptomyces psammosilenae]|uniref:Transcriptional regulator with XRE-family HTH domain n=1 Tax=Allostreptomyces psammosilenae TaxID=1892865 RepID=A0A852ZXX4_9ACTN|nr:helix-turn-helix transcriptional regulator [Allostreptomyces psammosilenae]NYI07223.1 transcriptional regulator with XRE-family HTH domain [Allostreptomyces psammosilenae]